MDLKEVNIVPDVLPNDSDNVTEMRITYGDIIISKGTEITPSASHSEPDVSWTNDESKFYTLFMTDPDAPAVDDPSFREFMHWIVTDIPGDDVKSGTTVVDYLGPAPPYSSGLHRYCFLVYEQKEKGIVNIDEAKEVYAGRGGTKAIDLVTKYDMGNPISANVMKSQWIKECDDYHEAMGLDPIILPEKYRSPSQKAKVAKST